MEKNREPFTYITNDEWVTNLFRQENINDHNHNKLIASSSSAVVRQRAFKPSDAKTDPQANGNEKGTTA